MAQAWTDSEEKLLKEDPLRDVKDEIQHASPHLAHVDVPKEDVQMLEDGVVKSHVPEAFVDELKNDHSMVDGAKTLGGTEAEFMEDDPLHNVKQELEHHSPHLKHIDSPYSPGKGSSYGGDVVKSEVPPAFEEELKNDHDIVRRQDGNVSTKGENQVVTRDLRDPGLLRGRPRFRMSTNVGNSQARNADPETANMCLKDEADEEDGASCEATPQESSSPTNDESNATKLLPRPGIPARGTPHFRISAHQGMRPGGPLSRDLKAESTETYTGGDGAGADLSGETKTKGPGLHRGGAPSGPNRGGLSNSGPRRGGLARTGSGVPGEQKVGGGSLARTGSGVPGEKAGGGSLARTGSGVPGNSLARQGSGAFGGLARTGSGIPSAKAGNDLGDFTSFLNSTNFTKEETEFPVVDDESGDQKGVLGKIGDKWNQLNSYAPPHGRLHDGEISKNSD